jgi:fatty acid desaturase
MRALMISLLDNVYHYGTPSTNEKAGKNLKLSPFVSALMLHGNYHETHHVNATTAWVNLPQMHHQKNDTFDGDFLSHAAQQFRGPLRFS